MTDLPDSTTQDKTDARQRLLEAAIAVFAEKGFEAASVREICGAAGANIASINYYFRDKEGLYIEAAKYAHISTCGSVAETIRNIDPQIPAIEQLRFFIREMATRMHAPANPFAVRLMMREMSNPSAAAKAVVKEYVQPLALRLREILRTLLPHLDEKRLLMTGFSVMGQILFYRQNRFVADLIFGPNSIESLNAEMVVEHITRFTFTALGLESHIQTDSIPAVQLAAINTSSGGTP